MKISIVVATDINGVIGKEGKLPWERIPEDMAHFKALTKGHHILMGRKTLESIGRALPERHNLVLTKDEHFRAKGVHIFNFLADAIRFAREHDEKELMIIGGEDVYRLTLPLAETIYLTSVLGKYEGDARFPTISRDDWKLISRIDILDRSPAISFRRLERR